jgi:hypothetical protein
MIKETIIDIPARNSIMIKDSIMAAHICLGTPNIPVISNKEK